MSELASTSFATLAAAVVLTAVVRSLAPRFGIVDRPDGRRKLHGHAIPRLGGAAVYAATVLGLLAVRFGADDVSPEFTELSTAWMIAAGFVCFVGSIDDRFNLPSRIKLVLQFISVMPIIFLGYYVDRVVAFGYPIELGWFGIPLTAVWLVGCINALNLIDGMDGLASIVGVATAAMMGLIAANEGHPHVAIMATILASALLGFLVYNLPPASVFLGDSGSMVIGLSVGLLGMQGSLKTSATLGITAPAVVMTLPMFDILAAIVRRKMTGRRFDSPDRLHIHHRLLDRGWTPWQILCLVGAICLATGAAATAATIFRRDVLAWVTAITLVVLLIRLRLFGYEEFTLVKDALIHAAQLFAASAKNAMPAGQVREDVDGSSSLAQASAPHLKLSDSAESRKSWDMLLHHVRMWNIRQMEFQCVRKGQFQRICWKEPAVGLNSHCCWSVSVSMPDHSGEVCELRASSSSPLADDREFASLTSLLKAFGVYFAAHTEQVFSRSACAGSSTTIETRPLHRKAA